MYVELIVIVLKTNPRRKLA